MGCNCGTYVLKHGEEQIAIEYDYKTQKIESLKFAFGVWEYDPSEWGYDENWERKEDEE